MKKNNTSIIILAAGKGSRMKSSQAKVLHNVCGKPMLYHIIKASKQISDDITVVIAHQKELVREQMEHYFDDINFVEQDVENFPGTGGALKNVEFRYENVLVLNGDMPLVDAVALEQFFKPDGDIVMSIFDLENPDGYGRVIIKDGAVEYIVEQKDATTDELMQTTVNAGVYAFSKGLLEKYIPLLSNDNAQKSTT